MPRKSAASLLTPHIGERPRLQPPTTGLSTRERQLFRDVVAGLSPEHLKLHANFQEGADVATFVGG